MKYFDKDGSEVEAFSEEDIELKEKEAIQNYIKENPSNDKDFKKVQDELTVANSKIKEFETKSEEDGKGSDEQKNRLLKEKKEAQDKLIDLEKKFTEEISSLKSGILGGTKDKILNKLSGEDNELKEKILLEYENFSGDINSESDIQSRLEKAFTIATGNKPTPNFMDGTMSSSARGEDTKHNANEAETENSKNMRKVFQISDQDLEKYSNKDK